MSTKTNCEKCIFADYADSDNPCAMGVLEELNHKKNIETSDSGFLSIIDFRCPFAFSTEVYKQHQSDIGSIDDLKNQLISRATINYYLIVILSEDQIGTVCQAINSLTIKPKFVSLVLHKSNNTKQIIKTLTSLIDTVAWKLHNILEDNPKQQDILDTVLSTSTNKNTSQYLWINNANSCDLWNHEIISINKTLVLDQPTLHAMFRNNSDGLFIGLHNYDQLIRDKQTDIISAIESIDNPLIHHYA